MKLSENFSLAEFTRSQTAARLGIDNTPGEAAIEAMRALCKYVLEEVRVHFGRPVFISSGFRSPELNEMIGGKDSSQHKAGEAVDFEVPGVDNLKVAEFIRDNLIFDQLILEFYDPGTPNSGWIHVSIRGGNRKEVLTRSRGVGYREGLG
jgi:hypothetical protein